MIINYLCALSHLIPTTWWNSYYYYTPFYRKENCGLERLNNLLRSILFTSGRTTAELRSAKTQNPCSRSTVVKSQNNSVNEKLSPFYSWKTEVQDFWSYGGIGEHSSPPWTTTSKLQLNYRTIITQNQQKLSWMEVWQLRN